MPQIFQMPPQMANLIAAGEVVERPGSVAKELVENAVDAGARHITVEIKNGGVTYLRVTDDGKGILPEDVRTAFLRHATSKVRTERDLEAIGTLGFRGEALAAISSVARVDLFTRTADNTEGVQITIEGGQETGYGETGCPVGTTVVIRDLFFNVPARAKFLKKDATESSFVENMVTQIAVSHPEVAIKFIKAGRESFSTPGDGKMLSAVYAAGGKDLAGRMLSLSGSMGEITVTGHIAPPEITRATRAQQHFFLNGRYIRSKLLTAALEEGYKGRLMGGRYPVCYLHITLHPSAVDVNVHPAKLEVKFAREREVFSAVYHAVASALDGNDEVDAIKARELSRPKEDNLTGMQQTLQVPPAPEKKPAFQPQKKTVEIPYETGPKARPVVFQERVTPAPAKVAQSESRIPYSVPEQPVRLVKPELTPAPESKPAVRVAPVTLPEPPVVSKPEPAPAPQTMEEPVKKEEVKPQAPAVRVLGEAFHTYIIAEDQDGLWLIDKHAAHEKLLFDRLKESLGDQSAQMLLVPQTVTLSLPEKAACLEHEALLKKAGFEIEDFGRSALMVRAAPMYLESADLPFVLSDIAGRLQSCRGAENELLEELLKSVACKAAVKAGMITDNAELQIFAQSVLENDSLRNCPHGRPCVTFVSRYQLEKLFKRVL